MGYLRAYPRVCGATFLRLMRSRSRKGLSPRVRGNQMVSDCPSGHYGPIPACAGQPVEPLAAGHDQGAYPRVCGATGTRATPAVRPLGLSPRVRGNRLFGPKNGLPRGPIPACAGQPQDAWSLCWRLGAYPRVCGATSSVMLQRWGFVGLSPRVRGNQARGAYVKAPEGPIPACAGQP